MKLTRIISAAMLLAALVSAGCATSTSRTEVPQVTKAASPATGIVTAGRIGTADIARMQNAGIRQVIDLTPDSETPGFDEASAVRAAGIMYSNLPLRGAEDLTHANVVAFDNLLREAQRPVIVHCASSNRVGAMAALRAAWIEGKSMDDAIAIGKAWGLAGLEPQVRERIGAGASKY